MGQACVSASYLVLIYGGWFTACNLLWDFRSVQQQVDGIVGSTPWGYCKRCTGASFFCGLQSWRHRQCVWHLQLLGLCAHSCRCVGARTAQAVLCCCAACDRLLGRQCVLCTCPVYVASVFGGSSSISSFVLGAEADRLAHPPLPASRQRVDNLCNWHQLRAGAVCTLSNSPPCLAAGSSSRTPRTAQAISRVISDGRVNARCHLW
jgi:hypothetical protein